MIAAVEQCPENMNFVIDNFVNDAEEENHFINMKITIISRTNINIIQ